jgi:hypothetical protein
MIPRVIVEAQDYRAKVLAEYFSQEPELTEEERQQLTSSSDLILDKELTSIKERTNYALLKLYADKGYDAFKETCLKMKVTKSLDRTDYSTFKGELAEVYLYVTIMEFIKKFNLNWKLYHSLVISKPVSEGGSTECDLILVAEEMLVVFEVKSYNGEKTITDLCTISVNGKKKNIYDQNALHCRCLQWHIKPLNLGGKYGMKSALFSFATGSLKDTRAKEHQQLMPLLTEDNVLNFLTALSKLKQKFWTSEIFDCIDSLVGQISMEEHLSYLKSINNR